VANDNIRPEDRIEQLQLQLKMVCDAMSLVHVSLRALIIAVDRTVDPEDWRRLCSEESLDLDGLFHRLGYTPVGANVIQLRPKGTA
jgi:hypothetical protein